jgi:DNA adenine methylase
MAEPDFTVERQEPKGQVLRYPGSKARLASWIVSLFPSHQSYLEPFAGSAVVLFAKPRCRIETLNDLDRRVVNLFRVLRDFPAALAHAVEFTPWARDEYTLALADEGDDLERARRFLVRCWQGFNASTADDSGWLKLCRPVAHGVEACRWATVPARIQAVAFRLKGVQIENRPALDVIRWAREPECLIYADPPYLDQEGRYDGEMSANDHEQLLAELSAHPGPVFLSAYDCSFYQERLQGWTRLIRHNAALNTVIRREVLWLNPVARAQASQGHLEI